MIMTLVLVILGMFILVSVASMLEETKQDCLIINYQTMTESEVRNIVDEIYRIDAVYYMNIDELFKLAYDGIDLVNGGEGYWYAVENSGGLFHDMNVQDIHDRAIEIEDNFYISTMENGLQIMYYK